MTFIDEHREADGVESICRQLPIAPSVYYEHKARERDPARRPKRALRNAALREAIERDGTDGPSRRGSRPELQDDDPGRASPAFAAAPISEWLRASDGRRMAA